MMVHPPSTFDLKIFEFSKTGSSGASEPSIFFDWFVEKSYNVVFQNHKTVSSLSPQSRKSRFATHNLHSNSGRDLGLNPYPVFILSINCFLSISRAE
jgi:hypothetical protein